MYFTIGDKLHSILDYREPLAQMTKVQQNQENVGQKVKPALDRLPGKPVNVYVPEIEFLSVVEFEQIPK